MTDRINIFNPSAEADRITEMHFESLSSFNSHHIGVFWSEAGGPGPWEMHPDSDELLHIIEGEVEVEILPLKQGETNITVVSAGSFIVVPQGCWHRQNMLEKSKEMYVSPESTLHSSASDPRKESPSDA